MYTAALLSEAASYQTTTCRQTSLARLDYSYKRRTTSWNHNQLEGKYSLESRPYRSLQKRNSRPSSTNHCPQAVLLLIYYRKTEVCLQYKNPRFTAFLDSNLHTRLAIVTGNKLGLVFPLGTFPKNFVQIRSRFIYLLADCPLRVQSARTMLLHYENNPV